MSESWKTPFVTGFFACLLTWSSLWALWDLARHQVELRTGYYDLPFGYRVPWWWAGDLFMLCGFIGMLLFLVAIQNVREPKLIRKDKSVFGRSVA